MDADAQYERVGRLVYGFHRWVNPERLRDPQALPPALVERGEKLLMRYDGVLASLQQRPVASDDDILALLADAELFAGEMKAAGAG